MTEEERKEAQALQDRIYQEASIASDKVYELLIHDITQEQAQDISNVLKYGTEEEVDALAEGIWEIYKDKL